LFQRKLRIGQKGQKTNPAEQVEKNRSAEICVTAKRYDDYFTFPRLKGSLLLG
jgi:hypothetical protein